MDIISHGSLIPNYNSTDHDNQKIIEDLNTFELGKFLLKNAGLNVFWTSYILLHPDIGRISRKSSTGQPLEKLEAWLLDSCPIFLATQEPSICLIVNLIHCNITLQSSH